MAWVVEEPVTAIWTDTTAPSGVFDPAIFDIEIFDAAGTPWSANPPPASVWTTND
jgi:hypothetical protein